MKTIPVCLIVAGIVLPTVAFSQEPDDAAVPHKRSEQGRHKPFRPFADAWKAADINKDQVISRQEFDQMERIQKLSDEKKAEIFGRLDKDGDGQIGREELQRIMKHHADGPPFPRIWEMDQDKSGDVSLEEMKQSSFFQKLNAARQAKIFERLDTNQDGVISHQDRPPMPPGPRGEGDHGGDRPPHQRPHGNRPLVMIEKLDVDHDGSLSFDEFRAAPHLSDVPEEQQQRRFKMMDRNGDQKISQEDFPPRPPRKPDGSREAPPFDDGPPDAE